MSDDDLPYEGVKGPRKTKPRTPKEPVKTKRKTPAQVRNEEANAQVVDLFGGNQPRHDPDGIVPENDPKKKRKKIRVGRRFTELDDMVRQGKITMKEFVATLEPEELVRGKLRDKNGNFTGAPPKWVPAEFHSECVRELLRRGQEMYRDSFLVAIEVFTKVADGSIPGVDPKDRLKAAQYIWERVEGKVPDRVEVAHAEPWETIISGIVAEAEDSAIQRASHVLSGTPDA
jgi:hypothetical protein